MKFQAWIKEKYLLCEFKKITEKIECNNIMANQSSNKTSSQISKNTEHNNSRIAKNTLLLYVRMAFMMLVSLYTSRVILNTLGVEDYGIYNVVGGVVAMFGFLNTAMASASQRYITFELGKNGQRANLVFNVTLQIHIIIGLIIVLLSETVGMWFLYNKMQIPTDRMLAAFWVLQFSIVSSFVVIISVPYNAAIVAHEKMSAFAYISILEVVLKLIIVFVLIISPIDRLILYAFLMLCIQIAIRFVYSSYCNRNFAETKVKKVSDRNLFMEMLSFAGWSLYGNFSAVLLTQGINMLLNIFFGPLVNAARGIAVQVQNAVLQFAVNFQMAVNPQITKYYASNEIKQMHLLIVRGAKFSVYLLLVMGIPLLFETDFILKIWLKNVPEYTDVFIQLILGSSLVSIMGGPMNTANQATGKVKFFQFISGGIVIIGFPFYYLVLKLGYPPYSVFILQFVVGIITQLIYLLILKSQIGLSIKMVCKKLYTPVLIVSLLSFIVPFLILNQMDEGWMRLVILSLLGMLSSSIIILSFGLDSNERGFILSKLHIVKRLNKKI